MTDFDEKEITEADILREEHFKRREARVAFVCQVYLETHRAIWEAEQGVAREVLFGNQEKSKEFEQEAEKLKEQFFIRTKRDFDEVDRVLS